MKSTEFWSQIGLNTIVIASNSPTIVHGVFEWHNSRCRDGARLHIMFVLMRVHATVDYFSLCITPVITDLRHVELRASSGGLWDGVSADTRRKDVAYMIRCMAKPNPAMRWKAMRRLVSTRL
ncbi:hypothetical protein Ahy_A10g048360 isoform A [Arachis hypogaea]|uniref:Uncharacterized protein n=1 Tax=Arachis hypogaea TaxID=3818 RepID=A0A445B4X7_ARAHY|nr:hypothetical protein Ahy_A10g048360 isoform A [Arachis hypogaea]